MKPSELYARKPESETNDINLLRTSFCNHIPEIDDWIYFRDETLEKNTRIKVKIYKDFNFDSRRFWMLASAWLDDKPVMIIQNAGREGDDHHTRFITDKDAYKAMIEFITSILPVEDQDTADIVDLEEDIPGLTKFYGSELDGEFKRY